MFKRGEVGGAGARPRVEVISGRCGEGQEDCLKNWGGGEGKRGTQGPRKEGTAGGRSEREGGSGGWCQWTQEGATEGDR